jgi:hypothetical protein
MAAPIEQGDSVPDHRSLRRGGLRRNGPRSYGRPDGTAYERIVLRQMQRDLEQEFVRVELCPRRPILPRVLAALVFVSLVATVVAVAGLPGGQAASWMAVLLVVPALRWSVRSMESGGAGLVAARAAQRFYRLFRAESRRSSGRSRASHRSRKGA